jgi:hypothetical protein
VHSIEPLKGPLHLHRTPLPSPGTDCQEMEENGARREGEIGSKKIDRT